MGSAGLTPDLALGVAVAPQHAPPDPLRRCSAAFSIHRGVPGQPVAVDYSGEKSQMNAVHGQLKKARRKLGDWLSRQLTDGWVHGHEEGEACNSSCYRTRAADEPPQATGRGSGRTLPAA